MADQNTDRSKISPGCFGKMHEMMRNMMPKKGGSCCPCAETMTEIMQECCSVQNQKENPTGKPEQEAPK